MVATVCRNHLTLLGGPNVEDGAHRDDVGFSFVGRVETQAIVGEHAYGADVGDHVVGENVDGGSDDGRMAEG